jgi:hypothetical protein
MLFVVCVNNVWLPVLAAPRACRGARSGAHIARQKLKFGWEMLRRFCESFK